MTEHKGRFQFKRQNLATVDQLELSATRYSMRIKGKLELARLSLINIHVYYVECKHVFHFCISRAVLYIIYPMSLYYQNTRTRSGNFPNFLFMAYSVLVLIYTSQTHVFRNPRQYLVEQNQWNAKQVLARPAFSL